VIDYVPALVEVTDEGCRPLHRLNNSVQQHTIEARVLKPDAVPVVLNKRVHGGPPFGWGVDNPIVGGPPFLLRTRQTGDFKGPSPLPSVDRRTWGAGQAVPALASARLQRSSASTDRLDLPVLVPASCSWRPSWVSTRAPGWRRRCSLLCSAYLGSLWDAPSR